MPSLNEFMRWHFRKRKKWQTLLEQYVAFLGAPLPQHSGKCLVTITRRYGYKRRAYDTDNLYAGAKPILDALKRPRGRSMCGLSVIEEDNPLMCELVVKQEKSSEKCSSILIEVLPVTKTDATL